MLPLEQFLPRLCLYLAKSHSSSIFQIQRTFSYLLLGLDVPKSQLNSTLQAPIWKVRKDEQELRLEIFHPPVHFPLLVVQYFLLRIWKFRSFRFNDIGPSPAVPFLDYIQHIYISIRYTTPHYDTFPSFRYFINQVRPVCIPKSIVSAVNRPCKWKPLLIGEKNMKWVSFWSRPFIKN